MFSKVSPVAIAQSYHIGNHIGDHIGNHIGIWLAIELVWILDFKYILLLLLLLMVTGWWVALAHSGVARVSGARGQT